MTVAVRHRGPDTYGFHHRADIAFGVRRLSIIDLVTGDQPITSLCTGATIAYNGELYNYRELRTELESRGHRFRTNADTEVVLHFYEEFGPGAFHRLNGMFAFAIDDPRKERVILARDQIGVKPLYLAQPVPGALLFASEPKALLATGLIDTRIDPDGLVNYLAHGHSSGEHTIYMGVRKLLAGHYVIWERPGIIRATRYWNLLDRARRWTPDAGTPEDEVEALLEDAVRRNMLADVPVGAFLSGGIDSSMVTALMRDKGGELRTYSVGFKSQFDELPDAARVAQLLGTEHTEITVSPEAARETIPTLADIYDEPFADAAAIPTYIMSRRARSDVTVVLTGEGGDEVFGGYRRYVGEQFYSVSSALPRRLRSVSAASGFERFPRLRRVGRLLRALAEDERPVRWAVWTEVFSSVERTTLLGFENRSDPYAWYRVVAPSATAVADDVVAMMFVELHTWLVDAYLEKVDKATMAASLEARVPLLDPRLVELLALAPRTWKIAGTSTKVLLRRLARRRLPRETIQKPKQGFGPPFAWWLRTSLRDMVEELTSTRSAICGLLEPAAVMSLVRRFLTGEPRESQIWTLLMLDLWLQRHGGENARLASAVTTGANLE